MELQEKSWHAKYYRLFYGMSEYNSLPYSLCEYFWKLMFALVLLPFVWTLFILKLLKTISKQKISPSSMSAPIGLVCWFLFWVFGAITLMLLHQMPNTNPSLLVLFGVSPFVGLILLSLIAGVITGIVYIIKGIIHIWPKKKYKTPKPYKEKKSNWFKEGVKAFLENIVLD